MRQHENKTLLTEVEVVHVARRQRAAPQPAADHKEPAVRQGGRVPVAPCRVTIIRVSEYRATDRQAFNGGTGRPLLTRRGAAGGLDDGPAHGAGVKDVERVVVPLPIVAAKDVYLRVVGNGG